MQEMCEFTYIRSRDFRTVHAKGIESSWYDLKRKFKLTGPERSPEAYYYETISNQGPRLFAIIHDHSVFYYYNSKWYKYMTAENVTCNMIPYSNINSLSQL